MPYPNLFTRLITPDSGSPETGPAYDDGMREYEKDVRRDVKWLLNAVAHPRGWEIYKFKLAADSVINFGAPNMAGASATRFDMQKLCADTETVLKTFEPRLRDVRVRPDGPGGPQTGKVKLLIEAELVGGQGRRRIAMQTSLDPAHGRWSVVE